MKWNFSFNLSLNISFIWEDCVLWCCPQMGEGWMLSRGGGREECDPDQQNILLRSGECIMQPDLSHIRCYSSIIIFLNVMWKTKKEKMVDYDKSILVPSQCTLQEGIGNNCSIQRQSHSFFSFSGISFAWYLIFHLKIIFIFMPVR